MKLKTAATLVLIKPNKMSAKGRGEIAKWLRSQARWFEASGKNYASRFTARYRYRA